MELGFTVFASLLIAYFFDVQRDQIKLTIFDKCGVPERVFEWELN